MHGNLLVQKVLSEGLHGRWWFDVAEWLRIRPVDLKFSELDHVTKIPHFLLREEALLDLDSYTGFRKARYDFVAARDIFFNSLQIYYHIFFVDEVLVPFKFGEN